MKFLTPEILVGIFLIHVICFSIAWFKTHKLKYILFVVTFTPLIIAYVLKIFDIHATVAGYDLFTSLKNLSWVMLAGTIVYIIAMRIRNKRKKADVDQ